MLCAVFCCCPYACSPRSAALFCLCAALAETADLRQRRNRCFADLLLCCARVLTLRRGRCPHRPACPDSPDCLFCSDIATVAPRAHFFCLARKSGQKEALDTDRIVPQATEEPRRRTLRPAHDKLSANLHYSAACAGTTLPSGAVATQGDGKTHCCGDNNTSMDAPVVQILCRGGRLCPPSSFFSHVCRGRWRAQPSATKERYGCGPPLAGAHRPAQCTPVSRESAANSSVPNGPMWASAPTGL